MTSVKLWRCERCGKWSHAQRQPRHHQRFIPAEKLAPDQFEEAQRSMELDDLRVFRVEEPWTTGDPTAADDHDGGVWVWCGPFDVWTAVKDA